MAALSLATGRRYTVHKMTRNRRVGSRKTRWAWLTGLWLVWAAGAAWGQVGSLPPAVGVSTTVVGILSYVRWPAEVTDVNLCVVGPSDHTDELLRVQSTEIAPQRRLHISRQSVDAELVPTSCQVVYLGTLDDVAWQSLLRRLGPRPIVTMGERREQCLAGGMFCLDVQPNSIAFEVNLDSLARGGVRVHPNVLQLARRKARTL